MPDTLIHQESKKTNKVKIQKTGKKQVVHDRKKFERRKTSKIIDSEISGGIVKNLKSYFSCSPLDQDS